MTAPKLLLPWGNQTIIESVLSVWRASPVHAVVVVVHPDDAVLASVCRHTGATVLVPAVAPAEMKDSVRLALEYVSSNFHPGDRDAWLLMPADLPLLTGDVIRQLLEARKAQPDDILVPTHGQRRGHPVLFPWSLAADVFRLDCDEGVNVLLNRHGVAEVVVDDPGILQDVDTPDEYERLRSGLALRTPGDEE